ncbi:MAG TPA: sialidase family protein [bacterium]|nr:sialidase family protein [bacterium]
MTAFLRLLLTFVMLGAALPVSAQTIVARDVSEDATEAASEPKIARDAQGAVHLTFVKPVGGVDQVHVASSTDNGRTWSVRQITTRSVPSRYPTLTAGPGGALHLAWTTYEPIGHVYYARLNGARWSTPQQVSPGNAYAGVPAIAADPAGGVHVVWYGIRAQAPQVTTRHGSTYEILYSGRSGSRWSTPVVISPGIPDSINPALAVDGSGVLHSAWYQFDLRAYQVRYTRRQREWDRPQQISTGSADAFAVALAVHPDGRAYLVWEGRGQPTRIYFSEGRDRWTGQQPISAEGRAAFNPSVAVDSRGRVHVVWESDGELYLRRRDRQWQGSERVAAEGKNTHPIVTAHGETIDLMWTQEIDGRRQIRFIALGAPGAAGTADRSALWASAILILLALGLLWQWRRRAAVARR